MGTSTETLAGLLLVAGAFYLLYGIVLAYHWIRYSESWAIAAFSVGAYAVAGVYLLGLMTAALFAL